MAIDNEGVMHYLIKDTSEEGVKSRDFASFLEEYILLSPETDACFVLDNAKVHRTSEVTNIFEEFEIYYSYLPLTLQTTIQSNLCLDG